jgi:ribosome-binding protein aMBF1 (putative translation factor)
VSKRPSSAPRAWLKAGAPWPEGDLQAGAPHAAKTTQAIVRRLHRAAGGRSQREIAEAAGFGSGTLSRLFNGLVVPDVATVARLEDVLGVELWPEPTERGAAHIPVNENRRGRGRPKKEEDNN